MAEFLSPDRIADAIRSLVRGAHTAKLAVAFWGAAAVNDLDLARDGLTLSVVCNLQSGAVEPEAIRLLLAKHRNIKTLYKLHAKIFWTDKGAIIGSANASANGLSMVGAELTGWQEAGLFIDPTKDKIAWLETKKSVDALFDSGSPITEEILEAAIKKWEAQRRTRVPADDSESVFSLGVLLRDRRHLIKDLNLWILVEPNLLPFGDDEDDRGYAEKILGKNTNAFRNRDWFDKHIPLGSKVIYFAARDGAPNFIFECWYRIPTDVLAHRINNDNDKVTLAITSTNIAAFSTGHGFSLSREVDDDTNNILQKLWQQQTFHKNLYRNRVYECKGKHYPNILIKLEDIPVL